MSADSTTRAAAATLPGSSVGGVGRFPSRRWVRRVVVLAGTAAAAFAFREWKLADNARRYGLPG